MAEPTSPHQSPMPAIRNQITVPSQPEAMILSRSPIPTPRNIENRSTASPDIRRRNEPSQRHRNVAQIQSERPRVEYSPTAQLIHKLFRNRDPRLLPDVSEISPLTPSNSRASSQLPEVHIQDESIYSEIPSASGPSTEQDDDDSSEYLSIDNLSLILNLDSIRANTPPPPYRSIFSDEK